MLGGTLGTGFQAKKIYLGAFLRLIRVPSSVAWSNGDLLESDSLERF